MKPGLKCAAKPRALPATRRALMAQSAVAKLGGWCPRVGRMHGSSKKARGHHHINQLCAGQRRRAQL
eukprot:267368-Prymnesium_polylepis.1